MKKLSLNLTLSFLLPSALFAVEITPMKANHVARFSQGVLDFHIQSKMQSGEDLKTLEMCFLKVKEEGREVLEVYKKRCPEQGQLNSFRQRENKTNIFELSERLSSTAKSEWDSLKENYAQQLAAVDASEINELEKEMARDSLGQLIFTELKGKKVNIGYVDAENRVMDLCSASWRNICYFDGESFKLGNETRERNYEEEPKNDWKWPRKYIDFEELVAGVVYSRGNDDSREQVIYYLTIPRTGKKVPITEEWYLYFHLNEKTRHLVEVALDNEGNPLKTKRTRREWNYMTAIHPLHIFKTRDRQTGEKGVRLYMGAAVVYDSNLNIESAECDMAETEGFLLIPTKELQNVEPVMDGSFLTALERRLLFSYLEETVWDVKVGDLTKAEEADYIRRRSWTTGENNPNNQEKYLPPIEQFEGINIFGMNAEAPLSAQERRQSFVILKSSYNYLDDPAVDPNSFEGRLFFSQKDANQVKKYLDIERADDGSVQIRLEGFNPNEMVANNPGRFKMENGAYELSYDPEAVFGVWTSGRTQLGETHTISRSLAAKMQKLKLKLSSSYYSQNSTASPRRDMQVLAKDLEEGREISEEERDWLLGRLDNLARFVGKNISQTYAVHGRVNHLSDLYQQGKYNIVPEMFLDQWTFPKYYLKRDYSNRPPHDEGDLPYKHIEVELSPEEISVFVGFIKKVNGVAYGNQALLIDHETVVSELFEREDFFTKYVKENQIYGGLQSKFSDIGHIGYFDHFPQYQDAFKRLAVATREQKNYIGRHMDTSLRPYALMTGAHFSSFDKKKLYTDTASCYVNAGVFPDQNSRIAALEACLNKYTPLTQVLERVLSEAGVPSAWELDRGQR
jgi:hypothetical protein